MLNQQWWHNATTGVEGVTSQHEDVVTFAARQMLDMFSPSNFALTNPEVLAKTVQRRRHEPGARLAEFHRGHGRAPMPGERPAGLDDFEVGRNMAATPGKVVYRNHLIELIQYAPTTDKVRPEPILIVPAWIMKYYILDLIAREFAGAIPDGAGLYGLHGLLEKPGCRRPRSGHGRLPVARASWTRSMRSSAITEAPKVHAVGYCLGGTLLSIAAAAMARDGDDRAEKPDAFWRPRPISPKRAN